VTVVVNLFDRGTPVEVKRNELEPPTVGS